MSLTKLVAITGMPGIHRVVLNKNNGLIVEDLDNGKRKFVSARIHQFTPLESISIYTHSERGFAELDEVFKNMLDQLETNPLVGSKASNEEVFAYFEKILPDYDRDRVYASDIKKLIKWFEFLRQRDLLTFDEDEAETSETTSETEEVVSSSED